MIYGEYKTLEDRIIVYKKMIDFFEYAPTTYKSGFCTVLNNICNYCCTIKNFPELMKYKPFYINEHNNVKYKRKRDNDENLKKRPRNKLAI